MNNDHFDDIIKQKTDGHQAAVPPDAWDNIKKKKKKRPFPFFWWSLSSLIIIGIVSTAILLNKNTDILLSSTDNKIINTSTKKDIISDKQTNSEKIIIDQTKGNNSEQIINDEVSEKNIDQTENLLPQTNMLHSSDGNKINVKKLDYTQKVNARINQPGTAEDFIIEEKETTNNDITISTKKENTANENTTLLNDPIGPNNVTIKKIEEKSTISTAPNTKEKDSSVSKKKENTVKKKKRLALIIDLSTTIFSPIQSTDKITSFKRINNVDNVHSLYTVNSFSSTLQTPVAFGIGIRKNINKKITIGSGFQYMEIKEKLYFSGTQTDTTFTIVKRLGYDNTNTPYLIDDTVSSVTHGLRVIDALNSYKLYSIPVSLNYTFSTRRIFSFSLTGGAYFTFAQYHNAINGDLKALTTNGVQLTNDKNKMTIDLFGGVRMSWLVNKYQFFIEPVFRYNLNKYELKHTLTNKNISEAGMSLGITYGIK